MHAHERGRQTGLRHWKCIWNCRRASPPAPEAAQVANLQQSSKQLHANGAMCSRASLEIAHQYWYTWHMTSEPKSKRGEWSGEWGLTSFVLTRSLLPVVCLSVYLSALIHLRIGVGNCMEIKLKTAQHFSAFRTPHGHFVHFANKYRTHSRWLLLLLLLVLRFYELT